MTQQEFPTHPHEPSLEEYRQQAVQALGRESQHMEHFEVWDEPRGPLRSRLFEGQMWGLHDGLDGGANQVFLYKGEVRNRLGWGEPVPEHKVALEGVYIVAKSRGDQSRQENVVAFRGRADLDTGAALYRVKDTRNKAPTQTVRTGVKAWEFLMPHLNDIRGLVKGRDPYDPNRR